MLLTRDSQLAARLRALRNQGRYPTDDWLQHSELGYNYRLSELACAIGIEQVRRLPSMLAARTRVAETYDRLLSTIPHLTRPPLSLPACTISWFVYVVRLAHPLSSSGRDQVMHTLQQQGIASARYFGPIHLQPAYADVSSTREASLPVTESISQRTLALPFFNQLSTDQAAEVVHALAAALARFA
jgi:perosamine synthetase